MCRVVSVMSGGAFLACVAVLGMTVPANAGVFYSQDFNSGDGGYVASTVLYGDPPGTPAPWTYDGAAGVGGSGAWKTPGGETGGPPPFEELLTSPTITVPTSGQVILDFDHTYDFEEDWDGGTLMMQVNSGGFVQVPGSAFTANGYTGVLQTTAPWHPTLPGMNGLQVFDASSGGFVHSTADLGEFQAGDTLQIQFRGGWDWYFLPDPSGWTIDNVSLTAPPVIPEPATLALLGLAACGLGGYVRRRRRA